MTSTDSAASPLSCFAARPSPSITRQNGQPTAIAWVPELCPLRVSKASSIRLALIRVPIFLHPHPGPAGATAERAVPVTRHLGHRRSRQDTEQLLRQFVDLVVPAEVARVVEGYGPVGHGPLRRRDWSSAGRRAG